VVRVGLDHGPASTFGDVAQLAQLVLDGLPVSGNADIERGISFALGHHPGCDLLLRRRTLYTNQLILE
jgi:hypothetical protein